MKKRSWLQLAAGMLVGAALGYFGMSAYDAAASSNEVIGWLLAVLVLLGLPLAILLHELGHVGAGRLNGFRLSMLVVGPVRLESVRGRLRLRRNRSLAMAGGVAVMLPDGAERLRRRMAWLVAGGPAASVAGGALLLAASLALPGTGPVAATVRFAVAGIGIASLGIAVATLIPGRTAGFDSDGLQLIRLIRNDRRGVASTALIMLVALSRAGRRPRDWPLELLERALSLDDGSETDALAHQLAAARHIDLGEMDEAVPHVDRGLELADVLAKQFRPVVFWEAAFFYAAHRRDAVRARAILDEAGVSSLVGVAGRLRAEAAVLAVEGRGGEALVRLAEARAAAGREDQDPTGVADEELDLVERLAGSPTPVVAT